jgi:formate hydrogenlyase subunit 5
VSIDDLARMQAPETFTDSVVGRIRAGARFCGVFASAHGTYTTLLAVLSLDGRLIQEEMVLEGDQRSYPSLTPFIPAAAWYEREIHDLFGIEPRGHPRLDPLVLPLVPGEPRPRPGSKGPSGQLVVDDAPLPTHVSGEGLFTIPYGPVRSGIFESVEFLVETPGEDIPHLRTRVYYKHRGIEVAFQGLEVSDGVLLAERSEGVAGVAHAVAFCSAVERAVGVEPPPKSGLVRVLHAELERVANHLDSTARHTEAAGQAVAFARFTLHKERIQRLRASLSGSRFSRGVVTPGGVAGPPMLGPEELRRGIDELEAAIRADARLLLATPSFIDRLRGTGVIAPEMAAERALVGPVGRGSGQSEDVRFVRPYAAYGQLGHQLITPRDRGDALARQHVRLEEIWGAFHLIRQVIDGLDDRSSFDGWSVSLPEGSGRALGWAEAPQGELLYLVEMCDGLLTRVKPRSASFHNFSCFSSAFPNDILTDFAFIEASFGISIAGVSS